MPNQSLSQKADEALNVIYKEYQFRKNSYYLKVFTISSLFPDKNNSDIMSALIELSKTKMIRLFSDKRIILNDEAIRYIESKLGNKIC